MLVPFTAKDFNTSTQDVTFPASNSASAVNIPISIPINDDNINEGGEVFVVFMELVDAVDDSRVGFNVRDAILCRIGDNDCKSMLDKFPCEFTI